MHELFPEKCLKIYRPNLAVNGIVVVLPAVGKKHLPYFTRAKWHDLFPNKCFIACADPSLLSNSEVLNGTWFLDKEKGSRLIDLADWLKKFIKENVEGSNVKIVFAGSSMGGYASIYLANLIEGSFAFAECPQINLYSYSGSKKAIEEIGNGDGSCLAEHVDLITLFKRLKRVPNVHIFVPATDVHHLGLHVSPYARAVGNYLRDNKCSSTYFEVSVVHSKLTPTGHAPISKMLFKENIEKLFCMMMSDSKPNISIKNKIKTYISYFKR